MIKLFSTQIYGFLGILVLLNSCFMEGDIVTEPVCHAKYFIKNKSKYTIIIRATENDSKNDTLLASNIEPNDFINFYSFSEGSGGTCFPSNAFDQLIIETSDTNSFKDVYLLPLWENWIQFGWDSDTALIQFIFHDDSTAKQTATRFWSRVR